MSKRPKSSGNKRPNLYLRLDPAMDKAVRKLADEQERPLAMTIRRLISAGLEKEHASRK